MRHSRAFMLICCSEGRKHRMNQWQRCGSVRRISQLFPTFSMKDYQISHASIPHQPKILKIKENNPIWRIVAAAINALRAGRHLNTHWEPPSRSGCPLLQSRKTNFSLLQFVALYKDSFLRERDCNYSWTSSPSPRPHRLLVAQMTCEEEDKDTRVALFAQIIGGSCMVLSVLLSLYLIYKHLRNYTRPKLQRCIIRIILMVPVSDSLTPPPNIYNTFYPADLPQTRSKV